MRLCGTDASCSSTERPVQGQLSAYANPDPSITILLSPDSRDTSAWCSASAGSGPGTGDEDTLVPHTEHTFSGNTDQSYDRRSMFDRCSIAVRSLFDRCSIEVRSKFDRSSIEVRSMFDGVRSILVLASQRSLFDRCLIVVRS